MNNTPPPRSAAKALLVGGGAPEAERVGAALGPGAHVICFAADRTAGETVRAALRGCAPDARVAVMFGDPALLVHKVSGPFDLIVDAYPGGAGRREFLQSLLAGNGTLDGPG